jgi:hypothetical protein
MWSLLRKTPTGELDLQVASLEYDSMFTSTNTSRPGDRHFILKTSSLRPGAYVVRPQLVSYTVTVVYPGAEFTLTPGPFGPEEW